MRNKIIEATIDRVIDESSNSSDFKSAFKQYIKNKFDDNAGEKDLKTVLSLIDDTATENALPGLFSFVDVEEDKQL